MFFNFFKFGIDMKIVMAIAIAIAIAITINSCSRHCVVHRVVSLLFSDRTYVQSQSIKISTGSHDYTSRGLKIQHQNGIKLTCFRNPSKTQYMTSLAKKQIFKNKSMQKQ